MDTHLFADLDHSAKALIDIPFHLEIVQVASSVRWILFLKISPKAIETASSPCATNGHTPFHRPGPLCEGVNYYPLSLRNSPGGQLRTPDF
jgi:hypothetical protein